MRQMLAAAARHTHLTYGVWAQQRTGELTCALYGVGALPDEWVEQVVRLNSEPERAQVAEDLYEVISERAGGQQRQCADVLSLLLREVAVAPQTEPQ